MTTTITTSATTTTTKASYEYQLRVSKLHAYSDIVSTTASISVHHQIKYFPSLDTPLNDDPSTAINSGYILK